jgi:hypothetical protein
MTMFRTPVRLLAAAVIACGLATGSARAVPANEGQPIDVVLCLDISGSMQELVASAKTKLWDIVNELAKVKPTPNLRVGLYSYGNPRYPKETGWVRKEIDLTTDLDEVYKKLNALTIYGGDEFVARVCKIALTEQKWSDQKNALRLIFVCGNEPVDQDKEVNLSDVARLAKEKGVVINTIYCNWGNARPGEAPGWADFAKDAGGKSAVIEPDKRAAQIQTPYDKDLLDLNTKLNATFIAYGRGGEEKKANQTAQDRNAAGAGAPALASRVATKGGALYKNSAWCIVSKVIEDPNFDVSKVPEADLPEELRKMKPEERVEFVKKKVEERKKIQNEIGDVSTKRAKYLAEEMKKNASAAEKELDTALRRMIREQGAEKGIKIPE